MEKINILFYESSSGFGGSSNALANIIKFLDREKFLPIVLIKKTGPQIDKIKNVEIIQIPCYDEPKKTNKLNYCFHVIKKILPEVLRIVLIIKKKNVSLVHINTDTITGLAPLIAARLTGIRCVTHVRGTMGLLRRQLFFSNWIDKFLIVNKKSYEIYSQHFPEYKLQMIYDGIDLNDLNDAPCGHLRKELNLATSPIVGMVGRIVEGKGQKEFVLSAKGVLRSMPEVKFVIVGDAKGDTKNYYKEVRELVTQEGLERSVIFTGWRNDIKNILSDFDILVQATTTFPEGFGLTITEAMALGKPVIASNIPGPSDIVIDGKTGFLITAGDVKIMSEKMLFLLKNKNIAEEMGKEGKKRIKELFDVEQTVNQIENLYLKLFSKN